MKVFSDVLGSVSTNCYYVCNEDTGECVIIDPAAEAGRIEERLISGNMKPVAILLTHGHFDHILATDKLREKYGIKVYANIDEKEVLESTQLNLSETFGFSYTTHADVYLSNGDTIKLAGMEFFCIATPGHTKGGMCYYLPESDVLFSGDTLFNMSVGRTDFPTGNTYTLGRSIREKLMVLPENTIVYPGHDMSTTIGYELANNPCF